MGVTQFHHANLGIPEDGVEEQTRWLVDILGYRQIGVAPDWPKSGPYWFEADDGSQIHLSRDAQHRPAAMAHVALVFDDLDAVRHRLDEQGVTYDLSDRPDVQVLNCSDPAGNRWELRTKVS